MKFGILGSGSWGTALAKILTDNGNHIHWWNRSEAAIRQFREKHHNPQYLSSAKFNMSKLSLSADPQVVVDHADVVLIAIPSAFVKEALSKINTESFREKKFISAVKGILPEQNILLNDYLRENFEMDMLQYFTVLGPCHAEEVAAEKLSYLTFTGLDTEETKKIASHFQCSFIKTIVNRDIYGVQYAAVLKNIYAVGAGIAHGLDYGDNFLSVLIANSADEMAGFHRKAGIINAEVGYLGDTESQLHEAHHNYAASVYLGDLLVTCYSLFSRNRTFGNMIGKGYTVQSAKLEMNMVAEGYMASRCMHHINQTVKAEMPVAKTVYEILWNGKPATRAFEELEPLLV